MKLGVEIDEILILILWSKIIICDMIICLVLRQGGLLPSTNKTLNNITIFKFVIFFYNIGIVLYGLMIQIVSLFNPKAKLWLSGRKNILDKITTTLQNENRPVIWFHCASLGEFEQGRPILDTIYQKYSEYAIVLTFFSPSGYEVRKNYKQADYIFICQWIPLKMQNVF